MKLGTDSGKWTYYGTTTRTRWKLRRLILLTAVVFFMVNAYFPLSTLATGQDTNKTAKEDYELQEQCARRAKERFTEEFDFANYAYQNHYNGKLNKCFIWVWSLDGATAQYLYDVNEKQYYGLIAMERMAVRHCLILTKSCSSEAEWDAFIKPYMEE
jgi:hypothetical protein